MKGDKGLTKEEYKKAEYIQLTTEDSEEVDTMYKRFDNGNMWIVQFNEKVGAQPIGMVYLTNHQVEKLFK